MNEPWGQSIEDSASPPTLDTPSSGGSPRMVAVTLSALTGLQLFVSFALQWTLVTTLGAGVQSDAFYAGSTISLLITNLMIDTLAAVLVPFLATCSEEQINAHGWLMCFAAAVLFGGVAVVVSPVADVLVPLLVPGFSTAGQDLAVALTKIQLIGLAGAACTTILTATFHVRNRFVWPAVAALASATAAWALVYWKLADWGVTVAAWAQVFAVTAPVALLLPGLGRARGTAWDVRIFSQLWPQMRPLMIARIYFLTNTPVDRFLASYLPPGSLVIFELVGRIYGGLQRVLNQGLVVPMLPQLSRLARGRDWVAFRTLYLHQIRVILLLSVVVVVAIEAVAIAVLFFFSDSGRPLIGQLTSHDVQRIALIVAYMSGVLPCVTIANASTYGYYAQSDTRTPTRIAIVAHTVGLVMRVVGFTFGGVKGLALALTVWATVYCLWLHFALDKHTAGSIRRQQLAAAS